MTALRKVSFKRPVERAPRLSKPYIAKAPRDERYWTADEDAIIRQYFPTGGRNTCLAHLGPHRTPSGVYGRAHKLGVKIRRKGPQISLKVSPDFDARLRKFYEEGDGRKRGECNAFADAHGLPRWWVTKRAIKLGLVMPHKKEPPWTAAEEKLMEKVPLHDPDRCARIFREHGFARSPTAIMVKAKRLNLSRRYTATFSATTVGRILGVDIKTVTREIIQGDLPAVKRPTKRSPQQGGDPWSIDRAGLRAYIIAHVDRIDFRKVDKFALVDALTNDGAPAKKEDGRSRPWTPERKAAQAKRMRARWKAAERKGGRR